MCVEYHKLFQSSSYKKKEQCYAAIEGKRLAILQEITANQMFLMEHYSL